MTPCWPNNTVLSPKDRAFFCAQRRKGSIFSEKKLSKDGVFPLKGFSDCAMVTISEKEKREVDEMKIVIALPEPFLREALLQRLRKRLSQDALEVVADGRALLDAVVTRHPQLVVMDTLLPEKDGLSAMYELRQLPESCQPEVILLSSLTSERMINEVARLQPAYFTTLPCDVHHLTERILLCCREQIRLHLEPCTGLEKAIGQCLHSLGLSSRSKGYLYAREAVLRIWCDPGLSHALTKCLYPDVARKFGTNPACVERAIRSAITAAWEKDGILWQQQLFHEKPTNGELFTVVADLLRAELQERVD